MWYVKALSGVAQEFAPDYIVPKGENELVIHNIETGEEKTIKAKDLGDYEIYGAFSDALWVIPDRVQVTIGISEIVEKPEKYKYLLDDIFTTPQDENTSAVGIYSRKSIQPMYADLLAVDSEVMTIPMFLAEVLPDWLDIGNFDTFVINDMWAFKVDITKFKRYLGKRALLGG